MQRRYDRNHVPIELLRTLLVISTERSFTKAGCVLGLTQSAISAQVKRFEQIIGGDVFEKSGGGLSLTPLGQTIVGHARRILQINDQMLSLPGAQSTKRLLRLGLPISMAEELAIALFDKGKELMPDWQIQLRCDDSTRLQELLDGGYLDVALLFLTNSRPLNIIDEWPEPLAWVCAPNLIVSPNQPLPYISWPNNKVDDIAMDLLDQADCRYVVSFCGADFHARTIAARAGLGYMLMARRSTPSGLKVAQESFLPKLPETRLALAVRDEFDVAGMRALLDAFVKVSVKGTVSETEIGSRIGQATIEGRPHVRGQSDPAIVRDHRAHRAENAVASLIGS